MKKQKRYYNISEEIDKKLGLKNTFAYNSMTQAWILVEAIAMTGGVIKTETELKNGKLRTLCAFEMPADVGGFKCYEPISNTHAPTAIMLAAAKALGIEI